MTPDPLERATRLLRDAVNDVGDVEELPSGRDVAIAALAGAIRLRARAERRRRIVASFAVAAGVVAIAGGATLAARRDTGAVAAKTELGVLRQASGVVVVRDGRPEQPSANERIAEGAELRTSDGSEARLEFESGTRVTASGGARLRLVEQSKRKRFALEAGTIFAKVAKLGADDRFVVATPDAEIEVRGTAFRVSLVAPDAACGGGTPTRLDVSEGVVVVRHDGEETRVPAGESWPKCAKAAPRPSTAAVETAPAPPAAVSHASADRAAPASASHLAEQNDLFDQAMREKREGRTGASVGTLERLLARYPRGPLAENAAVERMRMLAASSPSRGADAAREYLRRWPRGYARAEAESLSGTP